MKSPLPMVIKSMNDLAKRQRIVILGGGFAGLATGRRLERLLRRRRDIEIVLVSRDNFVVMTPLLFEVFFGTLDLRSSSLPVRAFLRSTRFFEASVQSIDFEARKVRLISPGQTSELDYDHLVMALGCKTNRNMIPGSQHAFAFKTVADALLLRNHVIERFERADVESNPQRKAQLLMFVIIGGGLVGVELPKATAASSVRLPPRRSAREGRPASTRTNVRHLYSHSRREPAPVLW
jgi:NADH:ubiquinone reductase (H+-translocating)